MTRKSGLVVTRKSGLESSRIVGTRKFPKVPEKLVGNRLEYLSENRRSGVAFSLSLSLFTAKCPQIRILHIPHCTSYTTHKYEAARCAPKTPTPAPEKREQNPNAGHNQRGLNEKSSQCSRRTEHSRQCTLGP